MQTPAETLNIARIIAALQDPAAYPDPAAEVHMVQTHVSCVFLTGAHVYKIKKPVNFGFLDYSTLDLRRHFCEAEVVLNRRLCPDIYLDTVPVTWQEGHLRIGGTGEPVEWAVRMLRLNEADMLPTRLAEGTVGVAEIEQVALRLAEFHANAETNAAINAFGAPETVFRVVGDTLHTMDRMAHRSGFTQMRREVRRFLSSRSGTNHSESNHSESNHSESNHSESNHSEGAQASETLFLRRVAAGRIRDCHGDLRAQNICLDPRFDGGIQIFDCIEFNPELRYIDTAADVAYLAMDLELAGRPDLREHFIAAYERAAGDTDLREILPYYQVYRAMVRGNIALLAASEKELGAAERKAQRQMAETAYALAHCYACRRERPALLIMRGFSGCGKSTLARTLCRRLPAIHLSSDRVRKELAGAPADAKLDAQHYTPAQRAAIYAEMRCRAEEELRRGRHVILDATFLAEKERNAAAQVARTAGAEFWIIDCRCPDPIIRERLRARHDSSDRNGSDADLAVYRAQQDIHQPVRDGEFGEGSAGIHLTVDTSQMPEHAAAEVISRFCGPRPEPAA